MALANDDASLKWYHVPHARRPIRIVFEQPQLEAVRSPRLL
jgi:hypothetical protein